MKKENLVRLGFLVSIALYLLLYFPNYYPFPQMTANILSVILNRIEIDSSVHGSYLLVAFPGISRILELSAECSGIALFSMFLLVIFIVPGFSLRHRLAAIPLLILVFMGNVVRIFSGILLSFYFTPEFLVFFHNTFGQVLIFFFSIGAYIIWLLMTGNFPREYNIQ